MQKSCLDQKRTLNNLKSSRSARCSVWQDENTEATYFTRDVNDRITVDLLQRIVLIEEGQAEWPEETSDLIDELWKGKASLR